MKPLGITVNGLARELKVRVSRMSEIVNGRRAINADAALRLSRYFGNTPGVLDQSSDRLRSARHHSFLRRSHRTRGTSPQSRVRRSS